MSKRRRFTVINRPKLIKLLEEFGYKITSQSSDGTYMLIRTPDDESTGYWLFSDRLEHRAEFPNHVSICSYFSYEDCFVIIEENSLSVIVKGIKNSGVFAMFFNFNRGRGGSK